MAALDSSTETTPADSSIAVLTEPSSDSKRTGAPSHGNCDADQSSFGRNDSFGKEEPGGGQSDGVLTSAELVASGSLQNVKAEAKHFDERKSNQTVELEAGKETQILAEKETCQDFRANCRHSQCMHNNNWQVQHRGFTASG